MSERQWNILRAFMLLMAGYVASRAMSSARMKETVDQVIR